MWKQVMLVLLILFSQSSLGAGVQIVAGKSSPKWEGHQNNDAYRFAYITQLEVNNTWLDDWGVSVNVELAYLSWRDFLLDDKHGMAITPMFRYRWDWLGAKLFVELGVGASYVNGDVWGDRQLGSRWMFEDKLAVGLIIKSHHEIALSAVHYSNADFADINDGADVFGLSYSYFW